jgi:hypothetical protein
MVCQIECAGILEDKTVFQCRAADFSRNCSRIEKLIITPFVTPCYKRYLLRLNGNGVIVFETISKGKSSSLSTSTPESPLEMNLSKSAIAFLQICRNTFPSLRYTNPDGSRKLDCKRPVGGDLVIFLSRKEFFELGNYLS